MRKVKVMKKCKSKTMDYVPAVGIGLDTISIVSFAINTAAFIIFTQDAMIG